jgi:hypothetical protein
MRLALLVFALSLLHAQDTRKVVEPSFPPACEVLPARLAAPGVTLPIDASVALLASRDPREFDQRDDCLLRHRYGRR